MRPTGSTVFRNLQAPSSALAVLGTLQPGAFRFLNPVDPSVSLSNYYIDNIISPIKICGGCVCVYQNLLKRCNNLTPFNLPQKGCSHFVLCSEVSIQLSSPICRYWSKFHPNRVKWYVQLLSSTLIKTVPANSYLVSFPCGRKITKT